VSALPISAVVPVYNGRELLEKLLQSVARQTAAPLEVIVVDNGSRDGAPDLARNYGARVVSMGRNAGFAAAVNHGIREARGEAVALLNSDVELEPEWLDALWEGMERTGVDFGAGKIFSVGDDNILDGTFDLISRGGCAWRAGSGKRDVPVFHAEQEIRFCPATAAIYRSSVFRRIGYFEERFESYLEDVDLGLRSAAANLKGGYFPQAVCRHRGSATFGQWNPRVVRLIARNQVLLVARHYPPDLLRKWLRPVIAGHFLWGLVAARHGCGIAYLRGKLEGLRAFSPTRLPATANSGIIEDAILESERTIYDLQRKLGFDGYWKFYFLLAGGIR
jgi:GT2 family glycosyltransferase